MGWQESGFASPESMDFDRFQWSVPAQNFIKPSTNRRFVGGAKLHIFNETTHRPEDMNLLSPRSMRTNVKNQSSHR